MRRTRFLSFFMLIILSLDLLLGITNVYATRFLDTNGDNADVIIMARTLFGSNRSNKAIHALAQEKMITHDAVIKKFANFLLYTDDELASSMLQGYIDKLNHVITFSEYEIDKKAINKYQDLIDIDSDVSIENKRRLLELYSIKKYKVFSVPHTYSDALFDEIGSKDLLMNHKSSAMFLKYVTNQYLDEVKTFGMIAGEDKEQPLSVRYTCGDLVTLYDKLQQFCFKNRDPNDHLIVNVGGIMYDLLTNTNRMMIYGQKSSYVISLYYTAKMRWRITRTEASANPVYAMFANQHMKRYDIDSRFVKTHQSKVGTFSYMGNIIFVDKFINLNMLANVLSSSLDNNKLQNLLQCAPIEILNDFDNNKPKVLVTQFGVMYLEPSKLTDEEVNSTYRKYMSKSQAIVSSAKGQMKKSSHTYTVPPFVPFFDKTCETQFGISYTELLKQNYHIVIDFYNNKFYNVNITRTGYIIGAKYPSHSLAHMMVLELIDAQKPI